MDEPLIIGNSPAIKNLRAFIKMAARSDSNVLILGETGVGKELAAKAIHYRSKRRESPFVKLNCANLNENLAESELFGHRRGAFTGAIADRRGLIEAANGGTFFFDEIGDISPWLQAKLLSVVEDKEIRRIGENNTHGIDVRFIFATNKDLMGLVYKGKFREDLLYRVNILSIIIAPLRDRKEDLPLLIDYLVKKENSDRSMNLQIRKEAIEKLLDYSFRGNIRELENILRRACESCTSEAISKNDVSFQPPPKSDLRVKHSKYGTVDIIRALVECKGNKTEAAKQLGMSRVHLYRLLDKRIVSQL